MPRYETVSDRNRPHGLELIIKTVMALLGIEFRALEPVAPHPCLTFLFYHVFRIWKHISPAYISKLSGFIL